MSIRIGTIILAAGESKRFGEPKQLAIFEGQTLIERAVASATSVGSDVVVVLGAHADRIRPVVPKTAMIVDNDQWRSGMASSIRAGLDAIDEGVDAVLIMLCDQPLVSRESLSKILARSENMIVAAEYSGTVGVPALFNRKYFQALRTLTGTEGAKKIILENMESVMREPMPECAFDVDTAEDFQKLTGAKQ